MMLKIKTLILRGFLVGLFCCVTNDSPSVAEEADLLCMAEAIYFESKEGTGRGFLFEIDVNLVIGAMVGLSGSRTSRHGPRPLGWRSWY